MFNFKQDLAYDEKSIIKRRQNEACILRAFLFVGLFFKINLLQNL